MSNRKFNDANNNPILILILGVLFLVGGIAALIVATKAELWVLIVGIVLTVVGAYFLPYGIYRALLLKRVKDLLNNPSAYTTNAQFVKAVFSGYSSRSRSIGVGNIDIPTSYKMMIFKKIVYTYTDQSGVSYRVKSILSYAPNQAKFLEDKQTFAIKCDGKISVIIEELPEAELSVNF